MQVIAVGGVVLRSEGDIEAGASAFMHQTQEARGLALSRPVAQHTDAPTVLQAKPSDIQGIGRGMLAAALTARDAAAGEAADMLDLPPRPAENPLGGRRRGL